MSIASPLAPTAKVTLLKTLQTASLVQAWQQNYGIDVAADLAGCPEIALYQCQDSDLGFFVPAAELVGSGDFYAQLQRFDWYYLPHKWEHDIALEDLQDCDRILEVGCAQGDFLARLQTQGKTQVQGIELNTQAVATAQRLNRPVTVQALAALLPQYTQHFDAICAFQVLEHLPDPQAFLQTALQLLRPHGKIILSVPNSASFIRHERQDLLNGPPHHLTRWQPTTFRYLPQTLPVTLERLCTEPLAAYHVDFYVSTQLDRLHQPRAVRSLAFRFAHQLVKPLLKRSPLLRQAIVGHTLYACLQKSGALHDESLAD